MGISSDGMLYFGFQVGGEDDLPEWMAGFEDFDEWLCARAGLDDHSPYEQRRKIIEECPADMHLFCSYDYPMYILGPRGSEHRVNRGYTKEIGPEELKVDPVNISAFKDWCESNEIEYQEPKWLLCSMYG